MEKILINEKLENLKKYYNYLKNYQERSIQEFKKKTLPFKGQCDIIFR